MKEFTCTASFFKIFKRDICLLLNMWNVALSNI